MRAITALPLLAFPFLLPASWLVPRLFAAALAVVLVIKALEAHRQLVTDREMWASRARRVLWALVPPDTRWPRSAEERRAHRLEGEHRLRRGTARAAGFVLCIAAATFHPRLHDYPVLGTALGLSLVGGAITAIADLVSGMIMLFGVGVDESFIAPTRATSPRDFWARRWNRWIHVVALRHLFGPLNGLRRPHRAVMVVFLSSGLMHEYLVAAGVGGIPRHTGWMTLFFAIHGAAVALQGAVRLRRRGGLPRPLAQSLHLIWFLATAPLFLVPLDEAYRFTSWRLW
jgi:hypothetical protein